MSGPIGSVSQLVAVIQNQLSARAAPGKARTRTRAGAGSAQRYAPGQLTALIELRVQQIAPDDPQRGRKAFRVFLEAVLLSHFGPALVADPAFFQLVDEVQGGLEADPACKQLVAEAMAHLLTQAE